MFRRTPTKDMMTVFADDRTALTSALNLTSYLTDTGVRELAPDSTDLRRRMPGRSADWGARVGRRQRDWDRDVDEHRRHLLDVPPLSTIGALASPALPMMKAAAFKTARGLRLESPSPQGEGFYTPRRLKPTIRSVRSRATDIPPIGPPEGEGVHPSPNATLKAAAQRGLLVEVDHAHALEDLEDVGIDHP